MNAISKEMSARIINDLSTLEVDWTDRLNTAGQCICSAVQSGEIIAAAVIDIRARQVLRIAIGTRPEVEAMLFA